MVDLAAPDLPGNDYMVLTADLSELSPQLREAIVKHLCHEDAARLAVSKAEQARAAQMYRNTMRPGENPHHKVGRRHSIIHVGLQQRLAAQYGHETAWQDPDFMKWILKNEESFRVPDVREKISTGWSGSAASQWPSDMKPKPNATNG